MKKTTPSKIKLARETVRRLTDEDIKLVAGGSSKICGTSDWCTQAPPCRTIVMDA
jgi:hypothetical protein